MASNLFVIVVVIFLYACPVYADIWCGYGPDSPTLDHSCSVDIDRLARAEMNIPAEWKKIPGVLGIGSGINVHHGFFVALQVYVKAPSMIPSVAARVPRSIDGVAVLVVTPEVAYAGDGPSSTHCTSGRSNDPSDSAYLPIEKKYSGEWMNLPGVLGVGPLCKDDCCDFTKVEVTVQSPLIDSVRNRIPTSIDGVPILMVPLNNDLRSGRR
jgi:hypothetical protein